MNFDALSKVEENYGFNKSCN